MQAAEDGGGILVWLRSGTAIMTISTTALWTNMIYI